MERPNPQRPGTRPSGIPRPSRLPVLSKRPSQILQNRPNSVDSHGRSGTTQRSSVVTKSHRTPTSTKQTQLNHEKTRTTSPAQSIALSDSPKDDAGQQRAYSPAYDSSSTVDKVQAPSSNGAGEISAVDSGTLINGSAQDHSHAANGSRPNLAERTVDSLSTLPATPGTDRRRSSFFNPVDSPMGPPRRPGSRSSSSRPGTSSGSRPGTSEGIFVKPLSPAKRQDTVTQPAGRTLVGGFGFNPKSAGKRATSMMVAGRLHSANEDNEFEVPPSPSLSSRSLSPSKRAPIAKNRGASDSKNKKMTGNVKAPAMRKSMGNLRGTPRHDEGLNTSQQGLAKEEAPTNGTASSRPHPVLRPESSKADGSDTPKPPAKSSLHTKKQTGRAPGASSSTLREQIAAAKAAAKKEKKNHDSAILEDLAFDGGVTHEDPFNQAPKDDKHILRNRVKAARMDGKLNIAALSLKTVPPEVLEMYSSQAMEESKVNWAEVVDLTKFIAADNEIEHLEDHIFPDKSVDELDADEDCQGNQFGGLETLDLHGNVLATIPTGLRRLERLTNLNLSHNKLDNNVIDVITQIGTLKELRLANNNLSGNLPASISQLAQLELLDIQANRVLSLPEAIRDLSNLKRLNVSGNQLTALPMEAISSLSLTELDASSNALIASLFPLGGDAGHSTLRVLNVSNNSLATLAFTESVHLPKLQELNISNNHLTLLPPISGWTQLRVLLVAENKISELPAGFSTLQQLRNVNLTSNDIRIIDANVGKMESLTEIILAGNPLQQKKYLTMTGPDIKNDLCAKLEPAEGSRNVDSDVEGVAADGHDEGRPSMGRARSSTAIMWLLKPGGTLDLALKGLSDDINDSLGSFLKSNEVRQLLLQHNRLSCIPPALWLGQDIRVLDLSGSNLGSEYLSEELELPALTELNLSQCKLTSLQPLMTSLKAPKLESLNITANRIDGAVPILRESYLSLSTLFACDNKFTSVNADVLRGMHTVNLANNDLQALPAEIGLLWDEGLRALEIGGNAFRVPSYTVLEKGTEAVMNWLKNKLPAQESWHDDELD